MADAGLDDGLWELLNDLPIPVHIVSAEQQQALVTARLQIAPTLAPPPVAIPVHEASSDAFEMDTMYGSHMLEESAEDEPFDPMALTAEDEIAMGGRPVLDFGSLLPFVSAAADRGTLNYALMTDGGRPQAGQACVSISQIARLHSHHFYKVGITVDPRHRLHNIGYAPYRPNIMYVLAKVYSRAALCRLEVDVIAHCRPHIANCLNRAPGGEGIARDAEGGYLYVVVFHDVPPIRI